MAVRDVSDEPQLFPSLPSLVSNPANKTRSVSLVSSVVPILWHRQTTGSIHMDVFISCLHSDQKSNSARLSPSAALAAVTLYVHVFSFSEAVGSFLLKEEDGNFTVFLVLIKISGI